jgi:DNA-binding CsgD family transcriptional regulator
MGTRDITRAMDHTLTTAEQAVAGLVAQGHSNREIAQRLFISHHTVEAHLTRIFRKLGLRSRVQLAIHLVSVGVLAGQPISG